MRAHIGDRLLVESSTERIGLIVGVPNDDGSPPYIVRWLRDGHLAMVFPDHYARIVPASHPVGTSLDLGQAAGRSAGSS